MNRTHIVVVALTLLAAGCSVEQTAVPAVSGPSEFGLSVTLTATPDQLPRDGSSQSVVTVLVRDELSRPVSGQRLTVEPTVGTVSQTEILTGSDGRASIVFTAPPMATPTNAAIVSVIPVGSDGANAVRRSVQINLTGPSNTTAPTFGPTPFTMTGTLEVGTPVRFDASGTVDSSGRPATGVFDERVPCMDACDYRWNFGDGSTGAGRITSHTYSAARVYTVTLVVTDAAGASASTSQLLSVKPITAPTISALTVIPDPPRAKLPATFTATAAAASGHSIVQFSWDFGDGTSQVSTSASVTKTFNALGTYVVTVTATDDVGQTASRALQVIIKDFGATASFIVSPKNPVPGQTVQFNGSDSTGAGGAQVVKWAWDFGDGSSQVEETDPITTHNYTADGEYTVRLTVTDSGGRTGSTTNTVKVETPD